MKSIEKFLENMKKIDTSGQLLTEDSINEIKEIFEAAVDVKATELKNQLKEEMENEAKELKEEMTTEAETLRDEIITEAEEFKDKLIDTLDKVLDESVNDFFEKYEDQIEDDMKLVFYENFFNHVKDGFMKHNIELSETDIDMISSLKKTIEKKDEIINEKTNEIYELEENVLAEQARNILDKKTKDMTEMEKSKLYGLIEDVDFNTLEEAEKKINLFIEKFDDVELQNEDEDTFDIDNPVVKTGKEYEKNIAGKWASLI